MQAALQQILREYCVADEVVKSLHDEVFIAILIEEDDPCAVFQKFFKDELATALKSMNERVSSAMARGGLDTKYVGIRNELYLS